MPIADLDGTQTVFAAPDDGAVNAVIAAEQFIPMMVREASLVALTVEHADGTFESIETTDEHPFHVADTREWSRRRWSSFRRNRLGPNCSRRTRFYSRRYAMACC